MSSSRAIPINKILLCIVLILNQKKQMRKNLHNDAFSINIFVIVFIFIYYRDKQKT